LPAAVFPGAIYFHAIFPTSMALFFMLFYLQSLLKKRFGLAFFLGLAAGSSYTSSFYLTGVALVWGWLERAEADVGWLPFILAALSPVLGTGLVFGLQFAETGSWTSFFRVWEFHRYNGWTLTRMQQMLYIPTIFHPTALAKVLVIAQSTSVLAVVLLVVVSHRKILVPTESVWKSPFAVQHLLFLAVFVFWVMPHLSPYRLSWYRAEAFLLPVVVLMSSLPIAWQAGFLVLWTPIAWLMALQFFRGVLV